jgi:O-antigen ligase
MTGRYAGRIGGSLLAGAVLLPLVSYQIAETSTVARSLPLLAFGIAVASPFSALLALAGLLPLSGWPLASVVGASVGPGEAILLGVLGGWLVHASWRRTATADPLARNALRPAWLLLLVIAASVVVLLFAVQPRIDYPWSFVRSVFVFLGRDYFRDHGEFDVIPKAATALESVGLFIGAATFTAGRRELSKRALAMVAAGAAGAAALNVSRFAVAAVGRGAFVESIWQMLQTVRISSAFADVNAAGSYFAMSCLVAAGLLLDRFRGVTPRNRGAWIAGSGWALVTALLGAALWLTGSRAAVASVVGAALLVGAWLAPRRARVAVLIGGALLVAGLALTPAAAKWLSPKDAPGRSLSESTVFRREMGLAAIRMAVDHPVFGVGEGAFKVESYGYIDPAYRSIVPRENAHNNYLQVLAELGSVGFLVFAWVVLAAAGPRARRGRPGSADAVVYGSLAGLLAFGLTCLAGHPLLIFEVSTVFWLTLGCVPGLREGAVRSGADAGGRRLSTLTIVAFAIGIVVVASVPSRGARARDAANLQSASIGLSGWETDPAGVSFRRITGQAQFYVPGDTTAVRLPVRLGSPAARAVVIDIDIDGTLVNRVRVDGIDWRSILVVLPRDDGRLFRPIRLIPATGDWRAGGDAAVWLAAPRLERPR